MRKLLLATAAAVLLSTPTLAVDLAPAPVEPAPVYLPFTWTGFYVGVHAGYAWGDVDDDLDDRFEENDFPVDHRADGLDIDGFIGGAHAGYNVQFDSFVIGIEGDVDFSGADGDHEFSASDGLITGNLSLDSNWQASIRARAGFAFDRTLIYATGGVAFADADLEFNGSDDVGDSISPIARPSPVGRSVSAPNTRSPTTSSHAWKPATPTSAVRTLTSMVSTIRLMSTAVT
jgi:outer membrane immunogenic protein